MTPGTTLGRQFSGDAYHRYGGGHLHRGRPLQVPGEHVAAAKDSASPTPEEKKKNALDEDMESSDDSSTTMAISRRSSSLSVIKKESPAHPTISIFKSKIPDSTSKTSFASSPATSSPEASPSSATSDQNGTHDPIWLGIVRTLEDLRDWIQQRLDKGEFEEGAADVDKVEAKIKRDLGGEKTAISEIGAESGSVYPILGEVKG